MSGRDWFRVIEKEVRAVAPVWAVCAVTMLGWKTPRGPYQGLIQAAAVLAYFVGAPAVGALSFGHEYHYGTWSFLLTQPVSRARVLLTKFGVLVVLLVSMGALATWLDLVAGSNDFGTKVLWMPVVLGAFVAPWLTLLVRRTIGAAVFAIVIPGLLFVAGQIAGIAVYGFVRETDTVATTIVAAGVSAACIAGAIFGWRRFLRLELVEDTSAAARAPAHVHASGQSSVVTRGGPTWRLLAKELRLQRFTVAMAAFYLIVYLISALISSHLLQLGWVVGVLTLVYGVLLAMIAGAVASAEERQLGTLDGELLLPISVRRQWTIKAATALALGVGLGYGVPALLFRVLPMPFVEMGPMFSVVVLIVASISLYVSSICRATLSAVMYSLPAYLAVVLIFRTVVDSIPGAVFIWIHGRGGHFRYPGDRAVTVVLIASAALLLAALIARLALSNHRYADRSPYRIAAHAALFVAALTAGLAVLGALGIR